MIEDQPRAGHCWGRGVLSSDCLLYDDVHGLRTMAAVPTVTGCLAKACAAPKLWLSTTWRDMQGCEDEIAEKHEGSQTARKGALGGWGWKSKPDGNVERLAGLMDISGRTCTRQTRPGASRGQTDGVRTTSLYYWVDARSEGQLQRSYISNQNQDPRVPVASRQSPVSSL